MGGCVIKTIGKGIVPLHLLDERVALSAALGASFSACAWVVLATFWKMPISTSHSIVGAVAGAGLAIGAPVKWKVLGDIFVCWFFTPLGAALLGFILYLVLKNVFYRVVPRRWAQKILTVLIVLSGCYVAFTWGANDVANATGVLAGTGVLSPNVCVVYRDWRENRS